MAVSANANNGGKGQLLQTLATSGNQWVQLGTLGLVAISGLTSVFQGNHIEATANANRDKALSEIHSLYNRVNEFEERNLKILANQKLQLDNQNEMLRSQQTILRTLHTPPQ
jgi:hypothetical protein